MIIPLLSIDQPESRELARATGDRSVMAVPTCRFRDEKIIFAVRSWELDPDSWFLELPLDCNCDDNHDDEHDERR